MEMESKEVIKAQLILEDKSQYFYSTNPVEICNSPVAVMATLLEYSISNNTSQNFKLYKTKEGNWYDIREANSKRVKLY